MATRWTFNEMKRVEVVEKPADVGMDQAQAVVEPLPRGGPYAWPWLASWLVSLFVGIALLSTGASADTTSDAAIAEHGDALDGYKTAMTVLIAVGAVLIVLALPLTAVWAFKMGWRQSAM